ncbi:MAG: hypothetical protein P4L85_07070 [Paludisphaera borealis]|uniref:DUF6580 family putative transport protein n=1 Tax=Paludisphaera borealis TaxID=1387353 RepID=UPI00284C8D80|nr:DUF6580 family putative transport protein [Paludisphaera borealis]MDR3619095.1 hypothetical protein [Paludisphaera borealis]
MLKAIALIAVTILYRLSPHPWNLVPMGAVSLYAGAKLPLRWAWTVPIAALVLSDMMIDFGLGGAYFANHLVAEYHIYSRIAVYGAFALTTLIGPLANRPKVGPALLPVLSLAASGLLFLTSNFAVWAEGLLYPMNLSGLLACYVAAIPFFDKTLLADLIGTAVLFSLGALVSHVYTLVAARRYSLADVATVDDSVRS